MTHPITPLRRALTMTATFVGPGFLMLFLITAFLGALQPMPGAKEALLAEAPDSLMISMYTGGTGERKLSQRSYLLVPASFQQKVMFVVTQDQLSPSSQSSQLDVSRSSRSAFYSWASIITVATAMTLFVSVPTLWRMYRSQPALDLDDDDQQADPGIADDHDHAQL